MPLAVSRRARRGPRRRAALALAAPLVALPFGVAAAGLVGCGEGRVVVRGTGDIVQEQRRIRPTDAVVVEGDIDLAIRLVPPVTWTGSARDSVVWVEGARDLVDYVETVVVGSELLVRVRDDARLDPVPSIEIQSTGLRRVAAIGSGIVRIDGVGVGIDGDDAFTIEAVGSVGVYANGSVDALVLRQAGAADLHLENVEARVIDHSAAGSGDAWIYATEEVRTAVGGAADVHVYGPARIVPSVGGAGKVRRATKVADDSRR